MKKSDLIQAIQEHSGNQLSKATIDNVLNNLTMVVHEELANDSEVTVPGLGKFSVKHRPERMGRNPRSGDAMVIPAARLPKFKAAKAFKDGIV